MIEEPCPDTLLSSLQNPNVKRVVKLRQRSHRDDLGLTVIEGYRELKRALDNSYRPDQLFTCADLFQGQNEGILIERCRQARVRIFECTKEVFQKISYRDRPEGLLAIGPRVVYDVKDIPDSKTPLIVVAESIEKPGNLGTILRTADATGVTAVFVCDRRTDINNPNVIRASIGCLFSLPVIEMSSETALAWLRTNNIQTVASTPHAATLYTDADFSVGTAVVVGTEQYGLSEKWLKGSDVQVRIPMLGQSDSLNVSAATTILLYEAVRQRLSADIVADTPPSQD